MIYRRDIVHQGWWRQIIRFMETVAGENDRVDKGWWGKWNQIYDITGTANKYGSGCGSGYIGRLGYHQHRWGRDVRQLVQQNRFRVMGLESDDEESEMCDAEDSSIKYGGIQYQLYWVGKLKQCNTQNYRNRGFNEFISLTHRGAAKK